MTDDQRWFHRRGMLAADGWETVVDQRTPGWEHTGLRVAELGALDVLELADAGVERIFVPLSGSFEVMHSGDAGTEATQLVGRASVFDGPTDVLYLGAESTAVLTGSGRIAIAASPTDVVKPTRYIPATQTPVELRGAGGCSRQVHNFGTPANLDAVRLIVCEVITPAENWSSYPPHKHDEHTAGQESRLEEIYYFEAARTRGAQDGFDANAFGMFSTYSSPAGEIDINAIVRTGDVALVPYGYHGPAVAAPGYDLYYLNVMAGPDPERAWLISDDPAHAWVRDAWAHQAMDDRLPYGFDKEGEH
jgi:5-deoxy-glucuronate isomerase